MVSVEEDEVPNLDDVPFIELYFDPLLLSAAEELLVLEEYFEPVEEFAAEESVLPAFEVEEDVPYLEPYLLVDKLEPYLEALESSTEDVALVP